MAIICIWVGLLLAFMPAPLLAQTETETCLDCHDDGEMLAEDGRLVGLLAKLFRASPHGDLDCIDCHSSPADYEEIPHYDAYEKVECLDCHDDIPAEFKGSVHEDFLADGDMLCTTCHQLHQTEEQEAQHDPGCGNCHEDAAKDYQLSVHVAGRRPGIPGVANCASCHGAHHVVEVADEKSPVHPKNIPPLCAECHADQTPITDDFVRLPIAVPNYLASVHGIGWAEGKRTAVCTDCHGTHDSRVAQDPESHIHRRNVAETCGQCHSEITREFELSIHGRAVALGILDSPTCTDCHSEHLIQRHLDPEARVSPEHRAKEVCGNCHTDPELIAKYGLTGGVVETYLDSYHGWAIDRGSDLVATCTDCHNVHDIRSTLDPASSVHPANVTATCSRCHLDANETFAKSYTHAGALAAKGPQGWVRLVYLWLIVGVLGGMALHNFVIAKYELTKHLRRRRREPYVQRWRRAERVQHLMLLLSFAGLGITGFALRFPDSWWVKVIGLGGNEMFRANLHRTLAIIMVAVAFYHMFWVVATRRGRKSLKAMAPRYWDASQAIQNMMFYLGLRKERPAFRAFDYTQKAEYWAVVWGTWVMALTGFILWYPTIATSWLPDWIVRVSEVIHFYEAVLAVSAIVIWHFFYVIFMPSEYPVSTIWLDGRMPADEWKENHRGDYFDLGNSVIMQPGEAERIAEKEDPAETPEDERGRET